MGGWDDCDGPEMMVCGDCPASVAQIQASELHLEVVSAPND